MQPRGHRRPVSLPRRFMGDLVHFAHKVPLTTMQRTMKLAAVAEARAEARPRPGWCSLFIRTYGLVATRWPELRSAYMPWPWPHFYEHPHSVAAVAIERRLGDENGVFFAHIRAPENQSLEVIESHLTRFKNEPIEQMALFRRILKTSRLPLLLRRLVWWYGLYTSGYRRACHFGTFGISVVSALGASGLDLCTPLTTGLNYGVLTSAGDLDVRLTYDHRAFDGGTAARVLADMEAELRGTILAELRSLRVLRRAA
jgi:hypothetical protein